MGSTGISFLTDNLDIKNIRTNIIIRYIESLSVKSFITYYDLILTSVVISSSVTLVEIGNPHAS